ncbi:hypothetical protein JKF63_05241 [Porcisia hertigi]|uniref:Uncharacterized protein n=1 Tax=Porcisia hertigi TaxID=2761500 RepID=A0A836ITB4_9TRYP|nr:hypothetical protein JKF63_05241 [Porcisia hertigi]
MRRVAATGMSQALILRRRTSLATAWRVRRAYGTPLPAQASLLVPFRGFFASAGWCPVVCAVPGAVGDHKGGCLRCTRPLYLGSKRQFSKVEALSFDAEFRARANDPLGTTMLELNLLEDPTAGLATGPAEELTPTELETRVRVLVSGYTPSLYRLLYMPFVDVVSLLVKEGLVPTADTGVVQCSSPNSNSSDSVMTATGGICPSTVSTSLRPVRPEEIMARWFTDGPTTLKLPHATAEAMGKRRWNAFCRALEAHWATFEDVMPLTRVVLRHHLREDLYIPLLRQLAMELVDPTKRASAVATLPGVILSLANGRAPRSLGLPENDTERVRLVSNLFLGVAQETGNTDLAYLAVQLLRANDMPTPFSAQKQLTNVFAAASRIETDWQMRATSMLIESYSKWLEYFRRVQLDNRVALEALDQGSVATASNEKTEAGGGEGSTTASPGKKNVSAVLERRSTNPSKVCAADSRRNGEAADVSAAASGERSTEQYRYFTSRQQDDVTRVTALEENIDTALRSRASELRETQSHRRRKKNTEQAVLPVTSRSDREDLSVMHGSSSAPRSSSKSPLSASRAAHSSEGVSCDADMPTMEVEKGDPLRGDTASRPEGIPPRTLQRATEPANAAAPRRRGKSGASKAKGTSRSNDRTAQAKVSKVVHL